jgi:hypothetical protein
MLRVYVEFGRHLLPIWGRFPTRPEGFRDFLLYLFGPIPRQGNLKYAKNIYIPMYTSFMIILSVYRDFYNQCS